MKIWLDDIRPAPEGWIWIKNPDVIVGMLCVHEGEVTDLSLDHDLAWNHYSGDYSKEFTGYDVLCQIEASVVNGILKNVPNLWVHSANPVGRKRMLAAIESIYRHLEETNVS